MSSCADKGSYGQQAAPLVEGAPLVCSQCGLPLCLRKQVINLALGNTEQMLCLVCWQKEGQRSPAEIIADLIPYVESRACFHKQWVRYISVEFCPDRKGCFPDVCFRSGGSVVIDHQAEHQLDLRGIACPMNYVKTKLYLDKLAAGDIVTVLVDAGEPQESVCQSVAADGHQVTDCQAAPAGHFAITIRKG